jgi:hypothetical protein
VTDQDRNKAWGFALFGDDVRAEVGGKLSLMGMYQAELFLPDTIPLPTVIPKFVILISYYEIRGALQEDISFKITYGADNDPLMEIPISRKEILSEQAQGTFTPDGASENVERIFGMRLPLALTPFVVSKLGRLRVRAHYSDGKILRLGTMAIRQVPEVEFQNMLGVIPPGK